MSTPLPPSDDDRPAGGESPEATSAPPEKPRRTSRASTGTGAGRTTASRSTTRKPASTAAAEEAVAADGAAASETTAPQAATAKPATARKTTGSKSAGTTAGAAAKKPAAPRTRRTTVKPAPIAPEGEAPDIMDATLGAREPLAGRSRAAAMPADTSTSPAEPPAETEIAATKRLPTAEEVYAGTPAAGDAEGTATAAAAATDATIAPAEPVTERTERPARTESTERLETSEPVEPVAATGPDVSGFDTAPDASPAPAAVPAAAVPAAATATESTERLEPVPEVSAHPTEGGAHPGASHPGAHGRTVNDLADRLDDSRFFSSLFDFTFTNYVTRKLAGPVYVVGLVLIGLGIVVGFANSLTSAIATHAPIGAFVFLFGVLITLVGAMLAVLLLRVGIEVFCAIIEIAQNTRRRRPPNE